MVLLNQAGAPVRTPLAEAFITTVETLARMGGFETVGINHWLAVACARPFVARTIAPDLDLAELGIRVGARLKDGEAGEPAPVSEVLAAAVEAARAAHETQLHQWYIVDAVLSRAGLAGEEGRKAPAELPPMEPPHTPAPKTRQSAPAPASASPPQEPVGRPRRSTPLATREAVAAPATPMLDAAGRDLTALARRGQLTAVVGRDAEMDQLIAVLCRPSKPNPLLVGEPGTGKTALVEGLAQRIAEGRVPPHLANRRLIALDIMWLVAESGYYGRLEQRLQALLAEAVEARAILFADETSTLLGAGGREQKNDVGSLLKPILARGEVAIISATTDDEYRRHIQADAALDRRFVVLRLQEPSPAMIRLILGSVAAAAEASLGVRVAEEALDAVPRIAASRLPDRSEPDRSKEILEHALAAATATGGAVVDAAMLEAAAAGVAGVPEVAPGRLAAMERELALQGVLAPRDAATLATRLEVALAGLALRPDRPRAVVLVSDERGTGLAGRLAAEIAAAAYGDAERVVDIDVGSIAEPSGLSSLIGTSQGYVGYQVALPIHELLQKPHAVVRFRGVDLCHPIVRAVLAKSLRDGAIVDATGRKIRLSSAVVLLEVATRPTLGRILGFAARGPAGAPPTQHGAPEAQTLVGDGLAAEADMVVVLPGRAGDTGLAAHVLGELACRYGAMGITLAWDQGVETWLAAATAAAPGDRERERLVEAQVAAAVRHLVGGRSRPARVMLAVAGHGLGAVAA